MKNKKRIVFGIVMILLAAGLLFLGFFPELNIFAGIPVWKMILGILLVCCCVDRIVFAEHTAEHFDFIFLLALLFVLFEKEIGAACGKEANFVSPWLVIGASLLLTIGIHALLENGHIIDVEFNIEKDKDHIVTDSDFSSNLSENTVYFDLSEKQQFTAKNRLGELNVYFQNEDLCPEGQDIELCVDNAMGEMDIFVPAGWKVECRVYNKMGAADIEESKGEKTRRIILTGENKMGEVSVRHIYTGECMKKIEDFKKRLIQAVISSVCSVLIGLALYPLIFGMPLRGMPPKGNVSKVVLEYAGQNVTLTDAVEVERVLNMTAYLKYKPTKEAVISGNSMTVTITEKDGRETELTASTGEVTYMGKTHELKEDRLFVNVLEGLYFAE